MSRVIDCILYSGLGGEPDVLDWRLHELADVVDDHLIIEGTRTFQGAPRAPALPEQMGRFREFAGKIRWHQVELPEVADHPLDREVQQRNAVARFVQDEPPDTLLILADVDEIPNAAAIQILKRRELPAAFTGPRAQLHAPAVLTAMESLPTWLSHGFVNMACTSEPLWYAAKAVPRALLDLWTPQELRQMAKRSDLPAGWHYSFLGGPDAMAEKLAAWSHAEWSGPAFTARENLERALREGADWEFTRGYHYRFQEPTGPAWLLAHRDEFARYWGPLPAEVTA